MSTPTCRSCWWQEGGRCYLPPVQRLADGSGRSVKLAVTRCPSYQSKRSALERVIPGKLTILSERSEGQP